MKTPELEHEAMFALVREACAPSSGDRERTRAALLVAIATGQASATSLRVDAQMAQRGLGKLGASSVALKVVGGVVIAMLVGWLASAAPRASETQEPHVPTHSSRSQSESVRAAPARSSVEANTVATPHDTIAEMHSNDLVVKARKSAVHVSKAPRLGEELQLIRKASQALSARDFETAHAALAEHAARFAQGELRKERQALDVLVRCAKGPSADALAARHQFLKGAAQSLLTERVRRACAADAPAKAAEP